MKKKDSRDTDHIRVREIRLDTEDTDPKVPEDPVMSARIGKSRNTVLAIVTYCFSFLFLAMAGYLIWFNIARRPEVNKNVYNTKQDASSENVIRGPIITENGTQLAYSSMDYTGNETRVYPFAAIFAHVIGYSTNGKGGMEASANKILMTSHSPLLSKLKDASNEEKVQGDTLVVTLDADLQQAAWNALGSYKGAVVAMEPGSGKILAMVSKPDFDPNTIESSWESMVSEDSDSSALLNRAVQGLYPPGSTFKILTTLAYLREHPADYSDFSWNCAGTLSQGDVTITCYNSEQHGQEDLETAFANSCNTAYASIGLGLDNSKFRKLAEEFMFNGSLPVDMPCSQSVFALRKSSSVGEEMTTAIGQGDTLVTPLHMALITCSVANGGILMKPYLIERVESDTGETVSETHPEIYKELMSVDEAAELTDFMKAVVARGTGTALSYNSYSVAGKTGSAEYESGGTTGTHSWFTGFASAQDPGIVVTVIAEDGGTGSSTAVPIAQQVFDAYFSKQ